jgi:hypothetical protein
VVVAAVASLGGAWVGHLQRSLPIATVAIGNERCRWPTQAPPMAATAATTAIGVRRLKR